MASFAAALRSHLAGSRHAVCEHCNSLVPPEEMVRIPYRGQQSILWEGCYECLEARLDDDRPTPSYDLLRRAYLALTTPLPLHEHEAICNDLQAALAEEDKDDDEEDV
jgi:hypothetical protein